MYSIYFNDKVINFTELSASLGADDYVVEHAESIDVAKVLQKVENSKAITLLSDDIERVFADFCAFFRIAEAAGGLVRNPKGQAMMIFRNGRWDLPKGHLENGETLEDCAVREVFEECGITGLTVKESICCTMHIYRLGEEWIIKKSHWYSMDYKGSEILKPQTEEGIEEVAWLDQAQVYEALKNSYETINQVFKCEKLIYNEK